MPSPFSPHPFLDLPHRICMAPLTRCRAPSAMPTALMQTYYAQRAGVDGASLIISEATQISPQGQGYPDTPGIFTSEHAHAWRPITDAVHAKGARIALQLWHVGRVSHPDFQPGHQPPVAPSAVHLAGDCRVDSLGTKKPRVTPRALTLAEIDDVINDYRHAARLAKDAGFDAVEIHAANSYLIDQFLRDSSNLRTDRYGGPIANRCRFLFDVADAVIDIWGADRVGVRLSPSKAYSGLSDTDPIALFTHAIRGLGERKLGFLHIRRTPDTSEAATELPIEAIRQLYNGFLLANGRYDATANSGPGSAQRDLAEGMIDAVAWGPLFISNPDLTARLRRRAAGDMVPLAHANPETFYGHAHRPPHIGYTDYPTLASALSPAAAPT